MDLISFFSAPVENSFIGWTIFLLLWICLAMIIFIILLAIDRLSVETTIKKGVVMSKSYSPEHTTYIYNAAAKCLTPVFHNEAWEFGIKVGNDFDTVSVNKSFYNKTLVGDVVNVSCGMGKIFKSFYVTNVW
jgi:hypothetical protein